jgi:uncharacterized protein (DUF885 family)
MRAATVVGFFLWSTLALAQTDKEKLYRLMESSFAERLAENPELATSVLGRSPSDDKWTDRSLEAVERRKQADLRRLSATERIDRATLDAKDQLNYDLFAFDLRQRLRTAEFPDALLAMDALFRGPTVSIPIVLEIAPATTVRDYENLLARLRGAANVIDQTIALLDEGLRRGVTQPAGILRDIPAQLDKLAGTDPAASPLTEAFRSFPVTIPSDDRTRLAREAAAALDGGLHPAFRKLRRYLTETYIPRARNTIARAALPDGQAWYVADVRQHTTTSLTPQQIHEIGLAEVHRIRGEMDTVIRKAEFQGDFPSFQTFLRTDSRFYFTDAHQLIAAYRDLCKRIDPELSRLFGKLPRAQYGVRPFPDYRAPSETSARYFGGSLGGSRPGYFIVNTYKLESRPKYEMEVLALHEAVPGHHLQIALALELEGVPDFRRRLGVNAYSEGWGLYAESLGEELGFYRDPYQKFGQLSFEMWRACRLVVDTGMHAMGWSRERAIEFMKANTALSEQNIVAEVDRYIAWPGQALGYKIGELKIKELRRVAEKELGARFDIREFHDAVLADGALPLDILENQIRAWIERKRK